jgi:hypothetical protein
MEKKREKGGERGMKNVKGRMCTSIEGESIEKRGVEERGRRKER